MLQVFSMGFLSLAAFTARACGRVGQLPSGNCLEFKVFKNCESVQRFSSGVVLATARPGLQACRDYTQPMAHGHQLLDSFL